MTGYERVIKGLTANIQSGVVAQSMINTHASPFSKPEQETAHWHRQLDVLRDAHVFEFDRDTAFLMQMTDNEPHPAHLPFKRVFIDAEFHLDIPPRERIPDTVASNERMDYCGLLLEEFSYAMNPAGAMVPFNPPEIQGFAYAPAGPFMADSFYPLSLDIYDAYEKAGVEAHMTRFGQREVRFLRSITYNFLDLLETPDVIKIQLHRGEKNVERRKRQGKMPLPPSTKVILKQNVVQRIYGDSKPWTPPSHRFWVRGHWRTFHDERYVKMRGQREWIYPFIKGRGILVKKKYVTPPLAGEGGP